MKLPVEEMRQEFGERLEIDVPLARHTSARLGGPADALVTVNSARELAQAIVWLWSRGLPYLVLGGGSNILVSDQGVRGVVVFNRARRVRFDTTRLPPLVWAESGANFGLVARQAASHGLAGLEWAVGVPGTIGGAVVGNAGAHGSDMTSCLVLAEILQQSTQDFISEQWPVERLEYAYRSSLLKRNPGKFVVLAAQLRLARSRPEAVQKKMDTFTAQRHRTQPPGATMGSMFKNPPGDYAGRLIEAAGLKGTMIGDAEISTQHANFFINHGQATAADVYGLIELAQQRVYEKSGVHLELEIELVGEWKGKQN